MPMYDFRCEQCSKEFEELVPRDYKEVPCPGCGSTETRRLLSTFASRTGGGGGYVPAPSSGGGCTSGG